MMAANVFHPDPIEELVVRFDGQWDCDPSRTLDRLLREEEADPKVLVHMAYLAGPNPNPSPLAALLELHALPVAPGGRGFSRLRALRAKVVADARLPEAAKALACRRAAELARPVVDGFLEGQSVDLGFDIECGLVVTADTNVVLLPGVSAPLRPLLDRLSSCPSKLRDFCNAVADGREVIDAEMASRFELYRGALEADLSGMFDDSSPDAVREHFSAFPQLLDSPSCLDRILEYLHRRHGLKDGLREGLVPATLSVLGGFRAWSPTSVRKLAALEGLFRTHPAEMTDAILDCIATTQNDTLSASVAALSLMAHARGTRERTHMVRDLEREERVAERVGGLSNGRTLLDLWKVLDVLAFCHDREHSEWERMGEFERTRWREAVADLLRERPPERRAFAEFVMTWMPRQIYEGLVPLLGKLMRDDDDLRHVEWIAKTGRGAAVWRAEALALRMNLLID